MGYIHICVGPMQMNAYVYFEEISKKAAVIDPGDDGDLILAKVKEKGLDVSYILLTHGHFDHTGAVEHIRKATGAALLAHNDENQMLLSPQISFSNSGSLKADEFIKDGDDISIGNCKLKVVHTPGHSAGSCCFYSEDEGILFSGDTLFRESVGRYDLPTGNGKTLMASIESKLFTLPDNTAVYPGHMGSTTIGHEKAANPFMR